MPSSTPKPEYLNYIPIFIFMVIAVLVPIVTLFIARFLRPSKPDRVKLMPYECGIEPEGDARQRFPVRYYIIALLFIVFDIEAVFVFPWVVIYGSQNVAVMTFLFVEMVVFFGIVIAGFIYIWKKGALKWV